jgi:peroxiredoxin
MVSLNTPLCDFGWKAVDFHLQGVDDTYWTLEKSKGENGLLVMFICNHCPYVKAILPRLVHDVRALKDLGIETIAIQSNDPLNYPEDSFENMKRIAYEFHFSFPYVIDETQEIAKAYNAICTPDFFGFNRNLVYEAMKLIAETQSGPIEQKSSIGCSIKWRE